MENQGTNNPEPLDAELGVSRTRGSLLLIGARAFNALFNLISVPIFLSVLGIDVYGALVFALVIHGLMSLADIGTSDVVQRQMSLALAANDRDELRELNRDQLSINLATGLILLVVGIACGLLIRLDGVGVGQAESFAIFVGLGIQSAAYRVNQALMTPLGTFHRFDAVSYAQAAGGLVVTATAVGLVYLVRSPWAYVAGMLVGELLVFAMLFRAARALGGWTFQRPAFNLPRWRPILRLCGMDYPNRAAAYFAAWGDKLMLGALTPARLADYRNAARLPDALRDMLQPLAVTSLPTLSRDFQRSAERFQASTLYSGAVVLFAACLALLVPTGFAAPLLNLWLGQFAPPEGAAVMALMGLYQALQLYVAVMGSAFFAMAKRGWFIPITALNALASLALTIPAYRSFGIEGIAWMNALVGGVQVAGLWAIMWRLGFPLRSLLPHMGRMLGILAVSGIWVLLGMRVSQGGLLTDFPVAALIMAPLACLAAMVCILGLGLAELPERISRRLKRPGRTDDG
jgi:O-antigen/teichoic acid export membrane protein